jgi:hypothetical protein
MIDDFVTEPWSAPSPVPRLASRIVETDLYGQTVRLLDQLDDGVDRIQVHVSLHIMQHCMSADLFSLMPISKRLRYRSRRRTFAQLSS